MASVRLKHHSQNLGRFDGVNSEKRSGAPYSSETRSCSSILNSRGSHENHFLFNHYAQSRQRDVRDDRNSKRAGVSSSSYEAQKSHRLPLSVQRRRILNSCVRIRRGSTAQASATALSEDGRTGPQAVENASEEKSELKTEAGRGLRLHVPRWLLGAALAVSLATAVIVVATVGGTLPAAAASGSAGATPGGLASITAEAVASVAEPEQFTINFFGLKGRLGEQTPGWIYFCMLMAAGFGLFVSEEALNMWVGASLGRALVWDGSLDTLASALAANAPAVASTVAWVYWGVCLSDMVPFFAGRWAARKGQAMKDKVLKNRKQLLRVTEMVQKYGNLIGFVERFSVGARNPTSFLAGAAGVAPDKYFAGVCLGGLITLPIQLGLGLACRDNPLSALAVVATVVGTWSLVPIVLGAAASLSFIMGKKSPDDTVDEDVVVA